MKRAQFHEIGRGIRLGVAKIGQMKTALEIGRLSATQTEEKYQIKSLLDTANLVMMEMTLLLLS